MIGKIVSHYEVLEKLGEGGTGVVYKALDQKLNRVVALKFFHAQLFTNTEQKAFLIKEAQAAAALNHPNIRTIYEIDETSEYLFLAMAFIDGASLKKKLLDGPLKHEMAVSVAVQVADGLEAAHNNGIVHRNLNSANILITDRGLAKILNFGLPSPSTESEPTVSRRIVNTTAYRSPELLRDEKIDHRTDIWSWGVVLYEALTGKLPFYGDRQEDVIHAVLNHDLLLASEAHLEIPANLQGIIARALSKSPANRYHSISEILAEFESAGIGPGFTLSTERLPEKEPQPSIAVLAFEDLSIAKDQAYFCDGIAEEIINNLARVDGLRVASRTSSFAYKGKQEDVRDIGRKLGVRSVLEGSVRRVDKRLRITTQLIDTADGCHLWTEQYDRYLEDVFAVQEDIAHRITGALKVKVRESRGSESEKSPSPSIEAYEFYLRGRQFFYRNKRKYMQYAIGLFSRAIARDPAFARAYAGKADCHSYLYWYFGGSASDLEQAGQDSETALELDPGLAEAHAASGLAISLSQRYEAAGKEFEAALELNPNLFEAYYFFAQNSFLQGRYKKAIDLFKEAGRVNPADYQSPCYLAFIYQTIGELDKMTPVLHEALARVERQLALNPDDSRAIYLGAGALIRLGERQKAMEWVKQLAATERDEPYLLYGIACLYALTDKVEESIYYLKKAVEAGYAHRQYLEKDSDFDSIREHPGYKALINHLKGREKSSRSV